MFPSLPRQWCVFGFRTPDSGLRIPNLLLLYFLLFSALGGSLGEADTTEITELLAPWKKTIDCIWILGLLTWPFGAARLVTWHYVLLADRRTLLQNECLQKNFAPWEINWKGDYGNHWTVTILSSWFPTVKSSSVSIHFEAKFLFRHAV